MTYAHRFLVVPDANRATAKELVSVIAPGQDMFNTGLNASGTGTPTDWISSGMIDAGFASLLGNAAATFSAYQQSGGTVCTLADVQALYTACPMGTRIRDDAEGREQECIAALGLKQIQGTL